MIVDASVLVDALAGAPARGALARRALAEVPLGEALAGPGLLAVEVLAGLRACTRDPDLGFTAADIPTALAEAADYGILIEATPWADVQRAHELSDGSLRWTDAVYVAAAERRRTVLVTADTRIGRSGADIRCRVRTLVPPSDPTG